MKVRGVIGKEKGVFGKEGGSVELEKRWWKGWEGHERKGDDGERGNRCGMKKDGVLWNKMGWSVEWDEMECGMG